MHEGSASLDRAPTTALSRLLDAILPKRLARHRFDRAALRRAAGAALAMSVVIIVTGSVVRVTGSGLGCDTWPYCSDDSLIATPAHGIHGAIEFGNRLLTFVLCATTGWLIVVASRQREAAPRVAFWAWMQFGVIALNALLGGVTVWRELNPYMVAAHFLAATLLLASAAAAWHRARELEHHDPERLDPERPHDLVAARITGALFALTVLLYAIGTAVTGSGPHAGDDSDVPRMAVDWLAATRAHSILAATVGLLGIILWVRTRRFGTTSSHRRVTHFLIVLGTQGLVGAVQVAAGLPEAVVVLHLLGAALTWVGAVRLFLDASPALRGAPARDG